MTLDEQIAQAREAIKEYNDAMLRGEEPHYPQWAAEQLRAFGEDWH